MLIDPAVHKVVVTKRAAEPTMEQFYRDRAEHACRRQDAKGSQMEDTAWSQVLTGRMSMAEYNRVCDKLNVFNRKA